MAAVILFFGFRWFYLVERLSVRLQFGLSNFHPSTGIDSTEEKRREEEALRLESQGTISISLLSRLD